MMMGGGQVPNPKKLDREDRVQSITHCGDSYKVSTADGKVRDFLERNLRVKTDVSDEGPQRGAASLCEQKRRWQLRGPARPNPSASGRCERGKVGRHE